LSTSPPPRVLVVDDDLRIRTAIERALRLKGFDVTVAADGREALSFVATNPPDVVVLDVLMPGIDGIQVCQRLRSDGDPVPVLMLTARDGITDRVVGLESGADDYLVKPFALDELVARLRALVRRVSSVDTRARLRFADLRLDRNTYEVARGDRRLQLTRTEFALLDVLLANPQRVLTREVLLNRVWGLDNDVAENTLPMFMSSLRRKMEEGGEARLVHTVRGVGYVLRQDPV
jgi:two-component system, OmpR family, response regulator MprA